MTDPIPTILLEETRHLDSTLRPETFSGYIGQETIKKNLHILLTAAQERKTPPEHILLYGPPGLGKTTLAHLIAKELGANLKLTSGPAIMKVGDLAAILTNLSPGDILFIDEIHRSANMSACRTPTSRSPSTASSPPRWRSASAGRPMTRR